MKTTKSPRRVLEYAHLIGKLVLPDYSHPNSPKIFTQPQLFACLVLKEFLRLDYRKLEALLIDAGDLAAVIGLDRVPTFSCFQKAAKRLLLNCHAQRYLDKSIRIAQAQRRLPRRVSLAALDGTGLESQHVSHYYVKRRAAAAKHWQKTTYQRFPKAGILCDTKTHLVLAVVPERGPGSDVKHFRRALTEAQSRVKIETLAADAGYDGEHHHRFARERCGVRSLIPPRIGRPTTKPPSGYWRRQMKQRLHLTRYSQRWQVETVNSMLKRLLGSALRARKYWSQCREILLRAITLNIMILRRLEVFYRAALALLERVLAALRADYEATGNAQHFDALKSCLAGGLERLGYRELAESCGLSEGAVKVAVHRLRRRYRDRLRREIAQTVTSPEEVEEEIRELFGAFRR